MILLLQVKKLRQSKGSDSISGIQRTCADEDMDLVFPCYVEVLPRGLAPKRNS